MFLFFARKAADYVRKEITTYQDENGFDSIGVSSIEKYKNVVDTLTKTLWTDGVPFNNYCKVSGTKNEQKQDVQL